MYLERQAGERPSGEPILSGDQLELVQTVAERLAASRDLSEVGAVVVSLGRGALGASLVELVVLAGEGRQLVMLASEGPEGTGAPVGVPVGLEAAGELGRVLQGGEAEFWSAPSKGAGREGASAGHGGHYRGARLPLVAQTGVIGALNLAWDRARPLGPSDETLLRTIALQCALAVDRAQLDVAWRTERQTLELLSEGTQLMVSALEPSQILASLVRLAVPRLAPWCAVYVAEGDELRRVAIEIELHPDLAGQLRGAVALPTSSDAPMAVAFRTGQAQLVPLVTADIVRQVYRDPQADSILSLQESWTAVIVPVRSGGQVIGVMSLVSNAWRGSPPAHLLFAAEGLAGRAGIALTNARRFEKERTRAAMLTEALLPQRAPHVPGYEIDARYLPAGSQVAGDWFDIATLPSGQALLAVGDAGGHGLPAASLMAQLRNGAHSLAVAGFSPGEILRWISLLTAEDGLESFATAIYAQLDPASGTMVWSAAGHLPPLVIDNTSAGYVEYPSQPPLGWSAAAAPPEYQLQLSPGEALLMVTDGVVERRGHQLAAGMTDLQELMAGQAGLSAHDLAQIVVEQMCPNPDDDCCVVVVKRIEGAPA